MLSVCLSVRNLFPGLVMSFFLSFLALVGGCYCCYHNNIPSNYCASPRNYVEKEDPIRYGLNVTRGSFIGHSLYATYYVRILRCGRRGLNSLRSSVHLSRVIYPKLASSTPDHYYGNSETAKIDCFQVNFSYISQA